MNHIAENTCVRFVRKEELEAKLRRAVHYVPIQSQQHRG